MEKPLLSIVVPTKNRYYYLKFLINLFVRINSSELELVIQDNSDDNSEFISYLDSFNCLRIKYSYVRGQIPMSDNSDKAILNSSGKYVCFLGDDDGFTEGIVDGVRWMEKNDVEAVKPTHDVCYYWPDAAQTFSSQIEYRPFSGKIIFLDPYKELLKVLKNGISNRWNMPLVYHAIVKREVLNRVYEKCGTFFPGNSPDISNAVALSLVVKKYALVDSPWAYSGQSFYRGGGVFARGNATPAITDVPWFRPNPQDRWCSKLPKVAAGTVIWADSAIESLKYMGREDLLNKIDFYKSYAVFLYEYPSQRLELYKLKPNRIKLLISYITYYAFLLKRAVLKRTVWKLTSSHKFVVKGEVDNIVESSIFLQTLVENVE